MIHFLRRIRRQLLGEKRFANYFLYAIGEILLVVIGILIALQLNTARDEYNKDIRLNNILELIQNDLKSDTTLVAGMIRGFEFSDSIFLNIINADLPILDPDSIDETNYRECIYCALTIGRAPNFKPKQTGYLLLKDFIGDIEFSEDSLELKIVEFYPFFDRQLDFTGGIIQKTARENFEYMEQFPWFKSMTAGEYNKEMITYFLSSEEYQKKVVKYRVFAVINLLSDLRNFKYQSGLLLQAIEERLVGT